MKKFICLMFSICFSFMLFAESNIMDYFPVTSGNYWIYANGRGKLTETVYSVNSMQDKDGTWCYLFQSQASYGKTSTLYGLKDGKIVKLVFRNILGQASEYRKPYPLVLAESGISYKFSTGDDYHTTTEKASLEFDGKKFNDCILVKEKLYSEGKLMVTTKSYYARNVGLVYVVLEDPDGSESVYNKLVETNLLK